jgi:phage-related baseplate assembly protein
MGIGPAGMGIAPMTNYHKLADLYAVAKAEAEAAEKRVQSLRKQIIELGQEFQVGDAYTVQVSLSERASLDSKAAKSFLTEAQIAECTKTSLVETLRIKASVAMAA